MSQVGCIECGAEITLDAAVVLNEILQCSECGVELEITSLEPLTLEMAPQEEEDWGE